MDLFFGGTIIYFILIVAFAWNSRVIIEVLIRVFIFVGIAGVTAFLSIKGMHVEELEQALLDLLGNAVKFTESGNISLSAALIPEYGPPGADRLSNPMPAL